MPLSRRGTGLVEAVVAALLTALLVVAALGSLAHLQRPLGRFTYRVLSEQSIRGTAQLLRSELRDLAPGAGELLTVGPGSLTYRAVRGTGRACSAGGGRVQVAASTWSPLRQPAAGRDSLVLLAQPGDTEVVVAAAGPTIAGTCPDGVASVALPYATNAPDPVAPAAFPAPLLVSEVMEIRAYESGGEWWVGVRSISAGESIQPAHGPLAANGLRISAFDSAGMPTLIPARVTHLAFFLRSASGDSLEFRLDYSRGVWR
jgi:hypothetical protein